MNGRGKLAQWPVRCIGVDDWPEVRRLFGDVFGHEFAPAFQHWKYGDGRGVGMGVWDADGLLVGHYGGGIRPVAAGAQQVVAVQMQDVMVAPSARDVLARMGPFGRMTRAAMHDWFAPGQSGVWGFGFPSARHLQLGQRLGLYHALDVVQAWSWPVVHGGGGSALEVQALDWWDAGQLRRVSDLARDVAPSALGWLAGVRGVDWWRHRYANHPEHQHGCWWIRRRGTESVALVVVRMVSPTDWEILDWLAMPDPLLDWQSALLALAQEQGVEALSVWCTPVVAASWPEGWRQLGVCTPACELAVTHDVIFGQPVSNWKGRVWMTGGDTDFR